MADQWQYPKETPYKIPGRGWLQAGKMFRSLGEGVAGYLAQKQLQEQLDKEQKQQEFLNKLKMAEEARATKRLALYEQSLIPEPKTDFKIKEEGLKLQKLEEAVKTSKANRAKIYAGIKKDAETNPNWNPVYTAMHRYDDFESAVANEIAEGIDAAFKRGDRRAYELYKGQISTIPQSIPKMVDKYGKTKEGEWVKVGEEKKVITTDDISNMRGLINVLDVEWENIHGTSGSTPVGQVGVGGGLGANVPQSPQQQLQRKAMPFGGVGVQRQQQGSIKMQIFTLWQQGHEEEAHRLGVGIDPDEFERITRGQFQ